MNTPAITKIASAIAAVFASCVTLGSVALLFDSAADRTIETAATAQVQPGRS